MSALRDRERRSVAPDAPGTTPSQPTPQGTPRDRSGVRKKKPPAVETAPASASTAVPALAPPLVDQPLRGLAFMLLASASFATMNALTSYLGRAGIPWQASGFVRALLGLIASVLFARMRGASLRVARQRTMWTRSAAGSVGMLCTFYALTHMPLADATTLLNTTPLWIALLAYLTVRETTSRAVMFALALAGAGVVLIEQPSLATGSGAGLVALSAGAAGALAMLSLRKLSGETPEAVVVHFSAVATGVMGALLAFAVIQGGGVALPHGALQWSLLVAVGLSATAGQLALTRAYALDRASRVGAAGWVQIVFAVVIDALLVGRSIPWVAAAGIAMIVAAGAVLVRDARVEARRLG